MEVLGFLVFLVVFGPRIVLNLILVALWLVEAAFSVTMRLLIAGLALLDHLLACLAHAGKHGKGD